MGDLNYQFSQVVPYGISDVYKATKLAIADTYGYKIKKADDNIICSIQIQVVILKRGVMQFGKYMF